MAAVSYWIWHILYAMARQTDGPTDARINRQIETKWDVVLSICSQPIEPRVSSRSVERHALPHPLGGGILHIRRRANTLGSRIPPGWILYEYNALDSICSLVCGYRSLSICPTCWFLLPGFDWGLPADGKYCVRWCCPQVARSCHSIQ